MNNSITPPEWIFVSSNLLLIADALMIYGVYLATRRLGKWKNTYFALSTLLLISWHISAIALAKTGIFIPSVEGSPIPFMIIGSIVASYLLFTKVKPFSAVVDNIPMTWLVGIQFLRVFGGVFLVLCAQGYLAPQFAIPAGTGDMLIGLSAIWVAYLLKKEKANANKIAAWWAILGILDLVIAVTMGALTSQGPIHGFAPMVGGGNNILIGMYPLVMIPIFRVPFMITLHLILLRKLRQINYGNEKTTL